MAGMELNVESLHALKKQIDEIDLQLDAVQGGTAGKRSIQNSLVAQNDETAEKIASQIVGAINKLSGEEKLGVYFGVISKLEDALSEEMDEALEALYESQKNDAPKISESEVASLTEKRKELSQGFKTLKEALTMFGIDEAAEVPDPKVRRGRTSRGPTIWGKYQYSINGEELPDVSNNMRFVAQRAGIKVADVKSAMEEQGIDIKNPPQTFSVNLPSDVVMGAVALEEYAEEWTEETEEETANA